MCYGCWEEEGSPEIETIEVAQLAMNLQKCDDFGALHILVSDWNCDDASLEFCKNEESLTEFEGAVLQQAKALSYEGRVSALALASCYWGAEWFRR